MASFEITILRATSRRLRGSRIAANCLARARRRPAPMIAFYGARKDGKRFARPFHDIQGNPFAPGPADCFARYAEPGSGKNNDAQTVLARIVQNFGTIGPANTQGPAPSIEAPSRVQEGIARIANMAERA